MMYNRILDLFLGVNTLKGKRPMLIIFKDSYLAPLKIIK